MGSEFRVTVGSLEHGSLVVLHGTVDRAAKEALESAYTEASRAPGRVVLDFTDVDYINSTGIAVIVGLLARARAEGREMHAFGLTDHFREVFTITRLADFMTIHDDERAAVAAG